MTCRDCIHYDVCGMCGNEDDIKAMTFCRYFKDKSRIIELPCKIGDTLYYVYRDWVNNTYYVTEATIWEISTTDNYWNSQLIYFKITYTDCYGDTDRANAIYGSRIFLTEEEAESKIKELSK